MREVTRGVPGSLDKEFGERSPEVRHQVTTYMREAPIVLASPSAPSKETGEGGPLALRSDGEWLWSMSGARMFESGEIDLEAEFVAHVIGSEGAPSELSETEMLEALAFIMHGDENNRL